MSKQYFFSKSTKLNISRKPLKINTKIKEIKERLNLDFSWDDEGRINYIDFDDSKKLLDELGSQMLSPTEYWIVLKDALQAGDEEMVEELTTDQYCEWLDRVYYENGTYIDHPQISEKYKYYGKRESKTFPFGRPGWFDFKNNINYNTGHPKEVSTIREKFSTKWKYWSPEFAVTKLTALAPIRGYVTSVGKPSLDLGIPVNSKQPVQLIRECRKEIPENFIDEEVLTKIENIISIYQETAVKLRNENSYEKLYATRNTIIELLREHTKIFEPTNDDSLIILQNKLVDIIGLLKLLLIKKEKQLPEIDELQNQIFPNTKNCNYDDFKKFLLSSKERLKVAIELHKDIVFVMGHKNPDTDTVVTSIVEAYRQSLLNEEKEYIPIVQSTNMPIEIPPLLGEDICNNLVLFDDPLYTSTKESGVARWIFVDQNYSPEEQKYTIQVIDHHSISDIAAKQVITKTIEYTGSCTALITQKLVGVGVQLDEKLAKILLGATLMDTENRAEHKMTIKDTLAMDYLLSKSDNLDETELYSHLMSFLLNTDDAEMLFKRDYKEDWGFGFGVAKVTQFFNEKGEIKKEKLEKGLIGLAHENNESKNLPLTLLRVTDYKNDFIDVNRERIYFIFGKNTSTEFRSKIKETIEKIIRFRLPDSKIELTDDYIEYWGSGVQLSRKLTAPVLEPIVKAYNKHFYSPTIEKWISREFLNKNELVDQACEELGIESSEDKYNRLNYITFPEAKKICAKLNYSLLSVNEYWKVLNDAKEIKDKEMVTSLQGANFVEFWDTAIIDKNKLLDHPEVENGLIKIDKHRLKDIEVPYAVPGLIHPNDINEETGVPKEVRDPAEFGNPELWRYWSPDADVVITTRSYIFLLGQPCWDGKVHTGDAFPNLGIRPVLEHAPEVKVKVEINGEIKVTVGQDGEDIIFKWE